MLAGPDAVEAARLRLGREIHQGMHVAEALVAGNAVAEFQNLLLVGGPLAERSFRSNR